MIDEAAAARFWGKVDKTAGQGRDGDCWQWLGALRNDGYPASFVLNRVAFRASHIALMLGGRIRTTEKPWALHSCDNPACVRPRHLRWGTPLENIIDANERRTNGRGFTEVEIRKIRASPLRQCEIAREYNTTSSCIYAIRKRISHKHFD